MKTNWDKLVGELALLLIFVVGYNSLKLLFDLSILGGIVGLLFTMVLLFLRHSTTLNPEAKKKMK